GLHVRAKGQYGPMPHVVFDEHRLVRLSRRELVTDVVYPVYEAVVEGSQTDDDALARVELAKVVAAFPDLHAAVRPLAGFTRRVLGGASQRGGEPDALPEHERLGRGHLAPPFTRASTASIRVREDGAPMCPCSSAHLM